MGYHSLSVAIETAVLFQTTRHITYIFSFCLISFLLFTQWRWTGQELSDASYNVHQTSDSASVDYDGSGFHSGGPSKTGIFRHR